MDGGPVKVLLVDDDEDDFVLTRDRLAEAGPGAFVLDWAASFDAGLDAIARGGHDVYLLDYRLGPHTGLDLLRAAVARGCAGPLILLTGQGDRAVDEEAMRAGAADYLPKARMDAPLLEQAIRHALERKRAEEELRRMHDELEAHVRDRTAELAAANAALQGEVAERARAERRLGVQYAVSRVLAEATALDAAVLDVLRIIGEGLGWQWGALWVIDPHAEWLQCGTTWHADDTEAPELEACSRLITFRVGRGLPGRVWATGRPFWVEDIRTDEAVVRQEIALGEGLERAFGFPVRGGAEILGVIEFFGRGIQRPDRDLILVTDLLGHQVGQFIERRRAELGVRQGEMLKGAILQSAMDCIITIDHEGRVVEFNPAAERTFHLPRAEVLGQPLAELIIPPAARDPFKLGLAHYLATGSGPLLGRRIEVTALRADGSEFPVEVAVTPIRLEGAVMFTAYLRDITERKRVERELHEARDAAEASSRAKDQFMAALSHELRTPLTPVLAAVSAMLEDPQTPHEVLPVLEMTRRNVTLEARLIDDLLDVTRIIQGKLNLQMERVDAHALILRALGICRGDIQAAGLRLETDLAAHATHVEADPARLQQVFWNLIKNAVKFTPRGGTLSLRSRNVPDPAAGPDARRLIVEVADTGIGIEPEALPRIFNAFEQGGAAITRQFGGLGLGLAISHSVVERLQGRLSAASAGRHQGATFTLEIAAIPAPATARSGAPRPAAAPRQTLRILLVEDHVDTLKIMSRLLGRAGHAVTTADRVAAAMEAAQQADFNFDLVISDLGLPDGSGLDLMRHIRARALPGIALSGFGMEEDVRKSLEAGFLAHLTKPVDFGKLADAIQQVTNGLTPAGGGH